MKVRNRTMKFGLCAGLDKISLVASLGYDYIEPSITSVAAMSDEEFAAALDTVNASSIRCEAFNVLFPGEIQLMSTPDDEIAAYLHKGLSRAHQLGGQVVVFGSGRARKRPDNWTYADTFRRLVEVTRMIGDIARQYDLTIVVEPLNRSETNTLNSMAEGAALCAAVNHPNVKLLCDSYHVATDNEPFTDIVRLGGVHHVHVATREGRRYPMAADEHLTALYAALKASGYDTRVSIEGGCDDIAADSPVALNVLRSEWAKA